MTAQYAEEPIAIVGSACRFPGGSSSPSRLWELLREPRDVLKEFDPDRLNLSRFHHHDGEAHGSTNVTNSSYILDEDTRVFDAAFFGINPVEAAGMDPQQRALLETVYEAIESAGMTLDELKGSLTSVHVGVMSYDWTQVQYRDPETVPQYTATGTAASILANRVSYIFDLRGPSATIDTACSSSLVALHQAARGLLDGDSEAAVVTGVNLILDPSPYIAESKLHMLSPGSRSRMWDKDADGYARGEGTAALLLKKLSRALADGDHIEGLVRATAVNSDGLSPGITMPVSSSQTALIRQTYRRAGLDPVKDRPQFFECHGTGTPAGDPVEARAVSDAFVAPHVDGSTSVENPLYVGSIKTVIGHLEGCAGLAGVMKVLLAIKHRTIPPNLLFNELNPAVAPYYGPLLIPNTALPWPKLPPGTPARASVNSFGFGGTNAHAIIESFEPENFVDSNNGNSAHEPAHRSTALGPLVFSAASGSSLLRIIRAHLEHLRAHPELNLSDLSWVLQARRTTHRVRAHFSGASREAILESMDDWVARHEKASSGGIGYQPHLVNPKELPGVLGVFTGQGAQWPTMGHELMSKSSLFRRTIEECEAVLRALPAGDAPTWSLAEELAKDASSSRLSEAALSQPLCTAVQLGLVDLLAASGIKLDAVVGHSSGEIAAVYASGIITRTGAMQIAYYRGFHAQLACGTAGQRGGMVAAGLSLDRATQFCNQPEFIGRLRVAASNAPQSVTLSGDIDAVQEAKQVLDADGIFARMLRVDTAYHSHHMQPCAEPYLKSILACDIQIKRPKPGKCIWNSSVRGNTELLKGDNLSALKGPYWVANMVQTVLFSQAVESSIWHGGPFDLAIEVGPHPALKGPVEQTLKAAYGSVPLYTGTLERGGSDVKAFSSAIGTVWAQLGAVAIDFAGYHVATSSTPIKSRETASPTTVTTTTTTTKNTTTTTTTDPLLHRPPVLKDLPIYSWDHDKVYWRESASSKRYRTARDGFNALLGRRTPDDNARELRWRNVLRLAELPWLRGHEILGQVLVPGATYVSFAVEACRQLGALVTAGREKDVEVSLLEVENLDIHRPLVVPDTRDGVETLFTARLVDQGTSSSLRGGAGSDILRAQFSYYVCVDPAAGTMVHTCTGDLAVHFRKPTLNASGECGDDDVLPPRDPVRNVDLVPVDWRRIYAFFEGLGLNHQGPLRAIKHCSRSFDYATATAVWPEGALESSGQGGAMAAIHVHPAMLDVAFQTVLVARAHPSSGQITTALLPSHIDRVRVSPIPIPSLSESDPRVEIESWAGQQTLTALTGDVNVYDAVSGRTLVQAEGLQMRMVGEPDAGHDRPVFAKTVWARDFAVMGGLLQEPVRDATEDAELLELSEACDRVALFYAQLLVKDIEANHDDRTSFQPHYQRWLEWLDRHLAQVATGNHPVLKREWLADGPGILREMDAAHHGAVQLQMLHAVGSKYASILRGEVNQLEVMTNDDLLNRFYMEDLECIRVNQFLASALREITLKYPRCNILEIGAGTGGTTRTALDKIDDAYASYTFTDLSSAFLASAAEKFADQSHKMIFKILDIDNDPATQGFAPHSYDIVIAANVLHATRNLARTLRRVRSMLRPGGYLLLFETTGLQTLSIPFIFGGLSGWWVSEEPDRNMGAIVPPLHWDAILQGSGFSGLDMVAYDTGVESRHTTSLLVSQAINDAVVRLREPLADAAAAPGPEEALLLIGGKSLVTAKMLAKIQELLPRAWRRRIQTADSIDSDVVTHISPGTDVICLQDEDEPVFMTAMTPTRLLSLQGLLMKARNLLWVTTATTARSHPPRAAMFHGIARVAAAEMPHLNLQVLGLEAGAAPATSARHCVETFLRLRETAKTITGAGTDQDSDEGTLLWAREMEVEVLVSGEAQIPRVVLDSTLNEVYAASKRIITKPINGTNLPIQAVPGQYKMMLQCADDFGTETDTSTTRVQVKYALHIPARTGDGVFLICGMHASSPSSSHQSIMAMSDTNASVIAVPPNHRLGITNEACTAKMLVSVANRLLVVAVATLAARTGSRPVLLYGADEATASELAVELNKQGSRTYFASAAPHAPKSWIKVHAHSSRRVIQRAVPRDVALFIDCTATSNLASAVPDALRDCLPPGCEDWQLDARLLKECVNPFGADGVDMASILEGVYAYAQKTDGQALSSLDCDLVDAAALPGAQVSSLVHRRYVTDWQKLESLLVAVPPLNAQTLFRPDRTYLMVGAAGGLGLSICRWILTNGAKHMVITSRNPKVDPTFLEDAQRAGASIRVLPMDVGSRASVDDVVKLVRATMPPIGGVCNAAMVLSDRLFLDMDVEQLNGTLMPKVSGSEHLDMAFADDSTLEFFIMLSSSASVLGNIGQANYHMANLFMTDLAAARRARGVAGSVVHVGHITDVGYVATGGRTEQLEDHFRTLRLMPLSETDVHHAFAQAIRGGRPGSQVGSPDIIMGVEPPNKPIAADVAGQTESKIPWLTNPRLGHLVPITTLDGESGRHGQNGAGAAGGVLHRIQDAESEEDAVAAVLEAFCAKLESTLQLPQGYAADNASRAAIDLGIDSLVAVEIRTWFLKELGVDVPVVKILGGDSVMQICTTAAGAIVARSTKISREQEVKVKTKPESNVIKEAPRTASPPFVPVNAAPAPTVATEVLIESDHSTTVSETNDYSKGSSSPSQDAMSSGNDSPSASEEDEPQVKGQKGGEEGVSAPRPKIIRQERMSRAQARIWFLSQHSDDPAAYNMVFLYRIHGPLNMVRLRHALQVTTHHHECLRMCFYPRVGDGHGMQGLLASSSYELEHLPNANENDLQSTMARFKTRVWDIEVGRTLGIAVLSRGGEEHDFILGYHHIISDVVGTFIFLQDLDRAYRLQPLNKIGAGSHLDFTTQLLEREAAGAYDEPLKFWREEFATLPEPLSLLPQATVHARSAAQQTGKKEKSTHSEYHTLTPAIVTAVKATCSRLRISPFHFYLAVLQVFLARSTGADGVCVGIVDANRSDDDQMSHMVGCFVNLLPVRGDVPRTASFAAVVRETSRKALAAFAHSGVPFDMLLEAVQAPRWSDGATAPLTQASINYRAAGWGQLPLGADCHMALRLDDGKDVETPYDVSLGLMDLAEGCTIDLHTRAALYSPDATREMLQAYVRLVTAFAVEPDMRIDQCPLHEEAQITEARVLGTGPETDFGWPATLSQRVRDMCRLHAAKPAVTDGAETLTYSQLSARVNSVAHALRSAAGTAPGGRVAVLCEPSVDATVAMLSVLQAGCVYVPLDGRLPAVRHAAMMDSCKPTLLLYHAATEQSVLELCTETSIPFTQISVNDVPKMTSVAQPQCASNADDPAILLFTSGSTGTPKGIILTQGNFVNHIALKTQVLELGPDDRVLQQSSLGFDMSVVQTFSALANGGCLVVVPSDARRDPVALTSLLRNHEVSLTIATPSEYLSWLHYGCGSLRDHSAWRHACMGGELVSTELKREFARLELKGLHLTNCYGPTEITAAATFQTIDAKDYADGGVGDANDGDEQQQVTKYAVGKALPNYSVCILDFEGKPQPVEHTGEICIGGAGVALGYLELAEETRAKFITDPMNPNQRLYRTGDRGRLMPDGTLLCFGRVEGDTQIKLRGLRVEIQEVENALLQAANGQLSAVVVSPRGDILVAHATMSPGSRTDTLSGDQLTGILGRLQLPQYFVPATIIVLAALPTNANGKLDRRAIAALPLPSDGIVTRKDNTNSQEVHPEKMNIREGELRLLWERVLPPATATMGRIVPSSDFFLRGGNSLLLMRLQSAIRESMGLAVSTRALYRASTLASMAKIVKEAREAAVQGLGDPGDIDWAAEAALPAALKHQVIEMLQESTTATPVPRASGGIDIVLTGATGFLGGRILHMLLQSPAVRRVHCIAVLSDDAHLLPNEDRIRSYTGSLADPTLGLSATEHALLSQTSDVIIHAGSEGHCLNNYETLRAPNVASTQWLAVLALPRAVPLLFVSSYRVALLGGRTAQPAASMATNPPPGDGREGLTASKWVAEAFLENLASYYYQQQQKQQQQQQQQQREWKVVVHRPCIVVGEEAPNSDSMNAILRFSLSMHSVPLLKRGKGYIDFTPADQVATGIARAALQIAGWEEDKDTTSYVAGQVQFAHHSSNTKVPVDGFGAHLEKVYGGHFEELPMAEWLERASAAGIDPLITAYLNGVTDTDEEMVFPYLGED